VKLHELKGKYLSKKERKKEGKIAKKIEWVLPII